MARQISLSYMVVAIFETHKIFELLLKVFLLKRKIFTTRNHTRSLHMLIISPLPPRDGSIRHGINSVRHFPSVSSFPEPLKEPTEMELDSFAFDQESWNESIHGMAFTFGTDEQYQPGKAQKEEEKPISLKVVSVTETQATEHDSTPEIKKDPPPTYSVVKKPKQDKEVEDVTL